MRINNYEIVMAFEIDPEVILSCGHSIKNLQKQFGGEIIHINNTEGAPPPLPRLIHKMKDTSVNLSLDRITVNTVPPSHVSNNITKSSKFAFQKYEIITKHILDNLPQYQWTGIIADIAFPKKSKEITSGIQAVFPVFERLVKTDIDADDLASFQLQFGFKKEGYFVNYTISGYEQRVFDFLFPKTQKFMKIDPDSYPVSECGIRLVLDVNNRPGGPTNNPISDAEKIFSFQNNIFKKLPTDLGIEGLLE